MKCRCDHLPRGLAPGRDNVPRDCLMRRRGAHLTAAARLPPRHTGFQSPVGSLPGFPHVGIEPGDTAGRRVFSGISRFPPLLHSGAAPFHSNLIPPSSALINSTTVLDLASSGGRQTVRSPPSSTSKIFLNALNLFTLSVKLSISALTSCFRKGGKPKHLKFNVLQARLHDLTCNRADIDCPLVTCCHNGERRLGVHFVVCFSLTQGSPGGFADFSTTGPGIGAGAGPPCCDVSRRPFWKPVTLTFLGSKVTGFKAKGHWLPRRRPGDVTTWRPADSYPGSHYPIILKTHFGQLICRSYSGYVNVTSLDAELRPRPQKRSNVDTA
ncbi:hypothetical protein PR048_031340 [Dryococelus australis]|uniref:Uncharacterized protein n=1 Tax=Dryococelus australis TaxID=614101 RepID=A0ABQ9G829_9NEOP|nr:hypothetical protein PR048_031340 [Dryococelus australis]